MSVSLRPTRGGPAFEPILACYAASGLQTPYCTDKRLLKEGSTQVWRVTAGGRGYVFKVYSLRKAYGRLQDAARPPERLYDEVVRLTRHGVPFAPVIGTARNSTSTTLVTREISGLTLHQALCHGGIPSDRVEEALADWGHALGAANAAGTLHIDPKTKNVIVTDSNKKAKTIFLIDVDGLRRLRWVPRLVAARFLANAARHMFRSCRDHPERVTPATLDRFFAGFSQGIGRGAPIEWRHRVARQLSPWLNQINEPLCQQARLALRVDGS